jgi:hypothetical protein
VTGSQQDAARRLAYPDDMAGGRSAQDAVLTDQQLLNSVRGTNLGDQLGDFRVPVAAIAADDEERVLDALRDGQQDAGDKCLRVVVLLEDFDLFAEARTAPNQLLWQLRR